MAWPSSGILVLYLGILTASLTLGCLNWRRLGRPIQRVPPGFEERITPETLRGAVVYARDLQALSLVRATVGSGAVAAFIFGGGLAAYDGWAQAWPLPWVACGVLFFLGLHWAATLLSLPFEYYRTFRLEQHHGFNRTGMVLWLVDMAKAEFIGSTLLTGLTAGALCLWRWSPDRWWVWSWALVCGVSLVLVYLSPVLIEPLFHRFTPVDDEGLRESIRSLAAKAGVRVGRVFRVDASRRTAHSNAYFSGIGRVKRVVLYDTLLEQMPEAEVLAVLAHELGHWRLRHMPKRLVGSAILALGGFWCAGKLVAWAGLPSLVGLDAASVPCRAVVLAFLASIPAFFLTPAQSAWSRRHEWAADRYASALTGDPKLLAAALATLARDNLANLDPHPLYAWFYASHPPIAQRVAALRKQG